MQNPPDRPLNELFAQLSEDLVAVVRREVATGITGVTHNAARAGTGLGLLAVGGALGLAALMAGLAAVIELLQAFLPAWLAALLIAAVAAVAAGALVQRGVALLNRAGVGPQQVADAVEEGRQWAQQAA
jgi:hypothetical protein